MDGNDDDCNDDEKQDGETGDVKDDDDDTGQQVVIPVHEVHTVLAFSEKLIYSVTYLNCVLYLYQWPDSYSNLFALL